jgi:hypothetical protein
MRYLELEHLSAQEFKRLCGVSRQTFSEMVEALRPHLERQGKRGGQNKLSVEDQLLVAGECDQAQLPMLELPTFSQSQVGKRFLCNEPRAIPP